MFYAVATNPTKIITSNRRNLFQYILMIYHSFTSLDLRSEAGTDLVSWKRLENSLWTWRYRRYLY